MPKKPVPKDMEKILNKQAQRSASKKSTSSSKKTTSSPKKSPSGKLTASQQAKIDKVRAGTKSAKIDPKQKNAIDKLTNKVEKGVKKANVAADKKAAARKIVFDKRQAAAQKKIAKLTAEVNAPPKKIPTTQVAKAASTAKKVTRPAKKLNIIQKVKRVMKAKNAIRGTAKTGKLVKGRKAVQTIGKLAKTASKGYKVAKLGAAAAGFLPELAGWEIMERAVPAAFNYQTGSGQYGGQYDEVNAQTEQNKANWKRRYQAALKQRAAKSRTAPNIGTNQTTTILGTMNEIPARPAPEVKSPTKMTPKEYKQYLKKRYR